MLCDDGAACVLAALADRAPQKTASLCLRGMQLGPASLQHLPHRVPLQCLDIRWADERHCLLLPAKGDLHAAQGVTIWLIAHTLPL